jgi:pantetheine-phosphate adenylyltransferase
MRRAVYPGSFDPLTMGHVDIIVRARGLFDEVVVAVAKNSRKEGYLTVAERVGVIGEVVGEMEGVRATSFEGLLVEFAVREGACALVRGLRAVSDFEYEFQMALTNRRLRGEIETVFLMPREDCIYLSSSMVKEIAQLGGDIGQFVPEASLRAMGRRMGFKS